MRVSFLTGAQTLELGPLQSTQWLNQRESGEAWQRHVLKEAGGVRVRQLIVVLDVVQRLELGQRRRVVIDRGGRAGRISWQLGVLASALP